MLQIKLPVTFHDQVSVLQYQMIDHQQPNKKLVTLLVAFKE